MIVLTIIKQSRLELTNLYRPLLLIYGEGLKLIQSCSSSDDVDEDHKVEDNEN